jgi:hypothetical protein
MLLFRDDKGDALAANREVVTTGWLAKGDHYIALYVFDHGGDWACSLTLERLVMDEEENQSWTPESLVIKHEASLRR